MKPPAKRAFDHVLVIMFENQFRAYVQQNAYMRRLAEQGADLANSFGVMHPSQTNYIVSIAGELCNVTSDALVRPLLPQRTIVDLLDEAGLDYRAYMESYVPAAQPFAPSLLPADQKPYYVKHNPFGSFASIVQDERRWRRVDNEAALFADLLNGEFPEFVWFTPNIWNDGHYPDGDYELHGPRAPVLVDQLACWLEGFFKRLQFPGPSSHLPPRTLVVVTFDESDFEEDWAEGSASAYDGPNQIYTVLLGDVVRPGVETEGYNHYSLLRTIEENFGLGTLSKNDAGANWMQFLWGRRFLWSPPSATPIREARAIAAAGIGPVLHVVYSAGPAGELRMRTLEAGVFGDERPLGVSAERIALAPDEGGLLLAFLDGGGAVRTARFEAGAGWSAPSEPIAAGPIEDLALAATDGGARLMLVWRAADGMLHSRERRTGAWGATEAISGFCGNGAVAVGALGAAVFAIYEVPGGASLGVISRNLAPFNVVTVAPNKYGGPQDNTTIDAWSPSSFPVASFSSRPDPRTPGEPEPFACPVPARGPLAVATLDGVMHLVHPGAGDAGLLTETFSIAGVMTPSQPVSYKSADVKTCSNGFGTLAEAGWTDSAPIEGASCGEGGALALAAAGGELVLLFQSEQGGPVRMCVGAYRPS